MALTNVTELKGKSHQFNFDNTTPEAVQQSIDNIMTGLGYKQTKSDWTATTYTKGNRVLRLLLGAFVKYNQLHVTVSGKDGATTAIVANASKGFSGGLIGMAQVNKMYKQVIAELTDKLGTSIF